MKANSLQAPKIKAIQKIELPEVDSCVLSNGLGAHFALMGTQEVIKIEFTFWAGRSFEEKQLIARTTAALVREGTPSISSANVAETFDFYGANLSIPIRTDTASFSLYCLSKQIPKVLPLFIDLLLEPAFKEQDLRAHIIRQQHRLREDLSKNEVVAYRQITEHFYGKKHPYGYNSHLESFANLEIKELIAHHKRCYNANNGFVIISGQMDQSTKKIICSHLERIPSGSLQSPLNLLVDSARPKKILLKGEGQMQSAIRVGRKLFPRKHSDADGVYVLATILGGYFGSRLMTNIREENAYTYQISADYESLRFDGTFQIDTEVSPEFVDPCLKEIQFEIERLQNDLVLEKELTMVRNYLMGSFLTMVDGPFNWSDTLRTLWIEQLDVQAFRTLINNIQDMSSEKIRSLAQSYLKKEDLWTVVVGNS